MRSVLVIILFILVFTVPLLSQTEIPGGSVSGSWNQTGSPYLILGDIIVPDNQTLIVEAGVEVNFQGYYNFDIQGTVMALGSLTDSIYFSITDTTGFSNHQSDDGGWGGFNFLETQAQNDSSKFSYCNIQYCKDTGSFDNREGAAFTISSFSKINISQSLIKNCIVDSIGGAIFCSESNPIISGCKITNNKTGIYCYNSSPIIESNVISGNSLAGIFSQRQGATSCNPYIADNLIQYNNSGIVVSTYSSPTIKNNLIQFNDSTDEYLGGGISCVFSFEPIIINNIIKNNSSIKGGAIYSMNCNPVIVNNLIVNNSAEKGGGLFFDYFCDPELINNTICNNTAELGGGCFAAYHNNIHVQNSIFWGNSAITGSQICFDYPSTINTFFTYNNIEGGMDDFGFIGEASIFIYQNNIDENPLFLNSGDNPYSLTSMSSCILAGNPEIDGLPLPEFDLAGNPRITNGRIDIGAYEFSGQSDFVQPPTLNHQSGLYLQPFLLTMSIDTEGAEIYYTTDGSEPSTSSNLYYEPITISETSVINAKGFHDNLSPSTTVSASYFFDEYNIIVDLNGTGDYQTIGEAINIAANGATIIVKDGVYTGMQNRNLSWNAEVKHLTIKSENGASNCTIDCEENGWAFVFDNTFQTLEDVIEGFTITNGTGINGGAILCNSTSPIITNCEIIGNSSNSPGGGIALYDSESLIKGNIISYNQSSAYINITAAYGGGIHIGNGSPTIMDNVITYNVSENTDIESWAFGGGICIGNSNALIKNNILTNNHSLTHQGISGAAIDNISGQNTTCVIENNLISNNGASAIFFTGNTVVRNNIITDNANSGVAKIGNGGTIMEIKNNDVYNNNENYSNLSPDFGETSWGVNFNGDPCDRYYNIAEDPLFISSGGNYYYLSHTDAGQNMQSPCVDAGLDHASTFNLDTYTTRVDQYYDEGIVDIGFHYPNGIPFSSGDDNLIQDIAKSVVSNYPNPFNPSTTIQYTLPQSCKVDLTVYNIKGQKVKNLVSEYKMEGIHISFWDGIDERGFSVGSGIYFYQLQTDDKAVKGKMILLK